jgi:serine/threonine protein kinase
MYVAEMIRNDAGTRTITAKRLIGGGSYGEVYLMSDGTVGKHSIRRVVREDLGVPRDGLKEIAVLKALAGPHVVALAEAIYDRGDLWFTMEHASLGSLRDYMARYRPTRAAARGMVSQLFRAISYVHSRNVVHRDIKPDNVLVFGDGHAGGRPVSVRLADFGSALVHGTRECSTNVPRTNPVTTLWYTAPEIAFGLRDMHTAAMDVWAAGLIACELAMAVHPLFAGARDHADLVVKMCTLMGIPCVANDAMPSYTATHIFPHPAIDGPRRPTAFGKHPADLAECPEWAAAAVRGALTMEPLRRWTAAACAAACDLGAAGSAASPSSSSWERCPKTPKIAADRGRRRAAGAGRVRSEMAAVMYETCSYGRGCGGSRREFHAAAKMYDRLCAMDDAGAPLPKDGLLLRAAGCSVVASKLCDSKGIGPDWSTLVRDALARDPRPDHGMAGLGRFTLATADVEAEELRILKALEWDVLDVNVIDVPRPAPGGPADHDVYCYVLDAIVLAVDTAEHTPYDIAAVAEFLARSFRAPAHAVHRFPVALMVLLEDAVVALGPAGVAPPGSMVHRIYSRVLGTTRVGARPPIDLENIRWM